MPADRAAVRIAGLVVLSALSGCYRSHRLADEPSDAATDAASDAGTDAAVADAGCGGESDVQVFLVGHVGAAAFMTLTENAVVGFGECPSGSIELGLDVGPPATPPLAVVSIPLPGPDPIDREGDWPCTLRAHFDASYTEESCVLTGRITGQPDRGYSVSLHGSLGGVGHSVAVNELSTPVCDLRPCP